VVLSGTGMPTLRAIDSLNARTPAGIPIVSSNLCLAWLLAKTAGENPAFDPWLASDAPWRKRLA